MSCVSVATSCAEYPGRPGIPNAMNATDIYAPLAVVMHSTSIYGFGTRAPPVPSSTSHPVCNSRPSNFSHPIRTLSLPVPGSSLSPGNSGLGVTPPNPTFRIRLVGLTPSLTRLTQPIASASSRFVPEWISPDLFAVNAVGTNKLGRVTIKPKVVSLAHAETWEEIFCYPK